MIAPGTILLDAQFPLSLEVQVKRLSAPRYAGAQVDLWTFDGPERRRAAELALAAAGVTARIRSAYKPLVHAFLEEIDLNGVASVAIRYPVVKGAPADRFLLESYPVAELVGRRKLTFEKLRATDGRAVPNYRVELLRKDGGKKTITVAAPNVRKKDHCGTPILGPTGWLRVRSRRNPALNVDKRLIADQEQAFAAIVKALQTHKWPRKEPYFQRLNLRVEAPFYDLPLAAAGEAISTAEAMHEDLYFSALEIFKRLRDLSRDERICRPGQIVPDIVVCGETVRVRVAVAADRAGDDSAPGDSAGDLDSAARWLYPADIKAHLEGLGGEAYECRSQRGRPIWGQHVMGSGPHIAISAGQHANETSGPVGALRAAHRLKEDGKVGFTVSPLENVDGYALFRELCAAHPDHMHHAARFTADGSDLEYVERSHENEIRHLARERTGADVHLNLHGYPAHEWTRPFTGYVPYGAELWTIPKGFFLILRYQPGWQELGEFILHATIDELAKHRPLIAFNRRQLARYGRYVPEMPFPVRKNIPYFTTEWERGIFPVTIITEAPDETVYGDDFALMHTAQMMTVTAAAQAVRRWCA